MPIRMRTWIQEFSWLTDPDGAVYAPVYELGAVEKPIYYCQCSLCGCIHELPHNQPPRGLYQPRCLLIEFVYDGGSQKQQWQAILEDWYRRWPEAAHGRQVHLLPVAEIPKPNRKAKVRAYPRQKVAAA